MCISRLMEKREKKIFDMYIGCLDFFYRYSWPIFPFVTCLLLICWHYLYSVLCLLTLLSDMLNILYQATMSLSTFFFAISVYTNVLLFTLSSVLVFSFLVSGFCILLRKAGPLIVYRALSFPFSHAALGHRDSVWYLVSPPETRKRRVREGKWLISGHTATLGKTEPELGFSESQGQAATLDSWGQWIIPLLTHSQHSW